MNVRKLVTTWGFEVDDKAVDNFEKKLGALKNTVLGLGAVLATQVGALYAISESAAAGAIENRNMAMAVGTNVGALKALQFTAKMSGVDVDYLNTGLRFVSRNALAAAQGNAEAAKKFESIGVNIRDVNGHLKTSDKLFLDIAERFRTLPDSMKPGTAMQLFGRAGAMLAPVLNKTKAELKAFADEGKQYAVGGGLLEKSEEFEQSQVRLQATLKSLRNTVAVSVMPTITEYINAVSKWYLANKDVIGQNVTQFFKDMVPVAKLVFGILFAGVQTVMAVAQALGGLGNVVRIVVAGMVGLGAVQTIQGIMSLVGALRTLWAILMQVSFAEALATGGANLVLGAAAAAAIGGAAYFAMRGSEAPTASNPGAWQGLHALPQASPTGAAPQGNNFNTYYQPQVTVDARGSAPGVEHKVQQSVKDGLDRWVATQGATVQSPVSH